MGALDGRIAIVTGAGRGLGREYALRLAARGGHRRGERRGRRRGRVDVDSECRPGRRRRRGRRDRGARWTGVGQRRRRVDVGRRRVPGGVHGRRPRWSRRPRQQRRHPARPADRQHDRGRVGRRRPRAPQGSLRADAVRGGVLARRAQGRPRAAASDRQHLVDVGVDGQPGAGELRRREVGHRHVHPDRGEGAGPLRRAVQLHRPGGPHPPDDGQPRAARHHGAVGWALRRVGPGEHRSVGGVPGVGALPFQRRAVLRPGRHGPAGALVGPRRHRAHRRPVGCRRPRRRLRRALGIRARRASEVETPRARSFAGSPRRSRGRCRRRPTSTAGRSTSSCRPAPPPCRP